MAQTTNAIAANTKFTDENIPRIAYEVCELIAKGFGLVDALNAKDEYPSTETFYGWLEKRRNVFELYARARKRQQDYEADNIIKIADTEPDPNKARIMIDARKWRASKLAPKKYGDKVTNEHIGEGGGSIRITRIERIIIDAANFNPASIRAAIEEQEV